MEAVIVLHDSADDLRGASPATFAAFRRVVAVDNGSRDGSRELARGLGAEVVERRNDGFGAAANAGARLTSGATFALMNPDIRFDDPGVVAAMAAILAADERIGLVAPALRLPDGAIQDSARSVPTPLNIVRRRWGDRRAGMVRPDRLADVPWVVAACVFVRRAAFEEVGGFDPRFFLYFEDVDLCVRLRAAGWRVVVEPSLVVLHQHRASSRGGLLSPAARRHMRSAVRFWVKHPEYAAGRDAPVTRTRARAAAGGAAPRN